MVTQTNAQAAIAVRLEYTNFEIVAQVLSWGYDEDFTGRITHYSLQYLEHEILHYLVDGTKDYIVTVDQFETGLAAIAPKSEIKEEYAIASTYERDGVQIDVVLKSDSLTIDCRHCWIEETLDDHIYCLESSGGTVVKSNWKTAQNNKWLNAYRKLWEQRNNERVRGLEAIARQEVDEEEINYIRSLEAAMY